MTEAKATKASPLVEFFRNATEQRKRDVYTRVIRKAKASQLQVIARAKEIIEAKRQEEAGAEPELKK
jgi:hypothetical protein